jgi:hypothetical protein
MKFSAQVPLVRETHRPEVRRIQTPERSWPAVEAKLEALIVQIANENFGLRAMIGSSVRSRISATTQIGTLLAQHYLGSSRYTEVWVSKIQSLSGWWRPQLS